MMKNENESIDSRGVNKLNLKLMKFFILYFLGVILWITGEGAALVFYFFEHRSAITTFFLITLMALIVMKGYEIVKQMGVEAFAITELKFVKPLGFKFFPIGDLILGAVSIYSAFYSGFTVLSLALLGQLPADIPIGGLLFIEISMASLMGVSGYCTYLLAQETLSKETVSPTSKAFIQTNQE